MIGQNQIIEMRKEGYKPRSIFVQAGFVPTITCRFDDPDRAFESKQYPEVWISPDELVGGSLDLRFAIGCRVHVHGRAWTDALFDFIDKLAEAAPLQIIAITDENADMMVFDRGEWTAHAHQSSPPVVQIDPLAHQNYAGDAIPAIQ